MNRLMPETSSAGGVGARAVVRGPRWEHPTVRMHLALTSRGTYGSHEHASADEALEAKARELKASHTPFDRDGLTLRWQDDAGHDIEMRYETLPDAATEEMGKSNG